MSIAKLVLIYFGCFVGILLVAFSIELSLRKEIIPVKPVICTVTTAEGKFEHVELIEVSDGYVEIKLSGKSIFLKNFVKIEQE